MPGFLGKWPADPLCQRAQLAVARRKKDDNPIGFPQVMMAENDGFCPIKSAATGHARHYTSAVFWGLGAKLWVLGLH